jgi:hypothetical protein
VVGLHTGFPLVVADNPLVAADNPSVVVDNPLAVVDNPLAVVVDDKKVFHVVHQLVVPLES